MVSVPWLTTMRSRRDSAQLFRIISRSTSRHLGAVDHHQRADLQVEVAAAERSISRTCVSLKKSCPCELVVLLVERAPGDEEADRSWLGTSLAGNLLRAGDGPCQGAARLAQHDARRGLAAARAGRARSRRPARRAVRRGVPSRTRRGRGSPAATSPSASVATRRPCASSTSTRRRPACGTSSGMRTAPPAGRGRRAEAQARRRVARRGADAGGSGGAIRSAITRPVAQRGRRTRAGRRRSGRCPPAAPAAARRRRRGSPGPARAAGARRQPSQPQPWSTNPPCSSSCRPWSLVTNSVVRSGQRGVGLDRQPEVVHQRVGPLQRRQVARPVAGVRDDVGLGQVHGDERRVLGEQDGLRARHDRRVGRAAHVHGGPEAVAVVRVVAVRHHVELGLVGEEPGLGARGAGGGAVVLEEQGQVRPLAAVVGQRLVGPREDRGVPGIVVVTPAFQLAPRYPSAARSSPCRGTLAQGRVPERLAEARAVHHDDD